MPFIASLLFLNYQGIFCQISVVNGDLMGKSISKITLVETEISSKLKWKQNHTKYLNSMKPLSGYVSSIEGLNWTNLKSTIKYQNL